MRLATVDAPAHASRFAAILLAMFAGQAERSSLAFETPGVTFQLLSSSPGWTCRGLTELSDAANAATWLSWVVLARPRDLRDNIYDGRRLEPKQIAFAAQRDLWNSWATPVRIRLLRRAPLPSEKATLVPTVVQSSGSPIVDGAAILSAVEIGIIGLMKLCPANTMEYGVDFTPVADRDRVWREGVIRFLRHPNEYVRASAVEAARLYAAQDEEMLSLLRSLARSDESRKVRDAAAAALLPLSVE